MRATTESIKKLNFTPFFPNQGNKVHYVAGPCSAESEEQVLNTARSLAEIGIDIFRAGIWKPRTRPNSFEGYGSEALVWLKRAKEETGLKVATEVANPYHLEEALKHGVDVVWIGARTVVNPFSVQAIADALKGTDVPVMVKNPLNPDLKLWIGAIERVYTAGVEKIAAVHRGFSAYGDSEYRNPPRWHMPIELRRLFPDLTFICDSSHIAGNRHLLEKVSQQALDLGYEGIHLEVHPSPDDALSDAEQQITPSVFEELKSRLLYRKFDSDNLEYLENLESLRRQIDEVDDELIALLTQRLKIARKIGGFKGKNNIALYQPERWNEVVTRYMSKADLYDLDPKFISILLAAIHEESLRIQSVEVHGTGNKKP
jgi:chorismate mutase